MSPLAWPVCVFTDRMMCTANLINISYSIELLFARLECHSIIVCDMRLKVVSDVNGVEINQTPETLKQ